MSEVRVGSDFTIFAPSGRWLSAASHGAPPVFPHNGARYHDIDTQKDYYWSGTAWTEVLSNPNYNDEYWEDLRFPATGISVGGFASPPDVETNTGLLLFDGTTTVESVGIIAQMPHSWREGSEVKPHVHWNKTTDAAGGVLWTLRYKILEIGEVETAWSDTISATLVPALDPGSTQAHAISEFPAIDMSGYHLSDMILFQLGRLYSDPSDTYEADVRLLEFDIHYQIDSHGSREEYVK